MWHLIIEKIRNNEQSKNTFFRLKYLSVSRESWLGIFLLWIYISLGKSFILGQSKKNDYVILLIIFQFANIVNNLKIAKSLSETSFSFYFIPNNVNQIFKIKSSIS